MYVVRNATEGKWHIPTDACHRLDDPAYNTAPLGDAGLCGRLDPAGRFPHVMESASLIPSAICATCASLMTASSRSGNTGRPPR